MPSSSGSKLMKTEHLVRPPKPVLPHIHPIHRSHLDAACEKQMPGFVTKLDEVNHCRRGPTERSGDVSPEQIESGNKQRIRGTTGRTCMNVLARPAHQSEVCEGQVTVWAVTVTHQVAILHFPIYAAPASRANTVLLTVRGVLLSIQSSPSLPSFL